LRPAMVGEPHPRSHRGDPLSFPGLPETARSLKP
jgi:hypothetical protein